MPKEEAPTSSGQRAAEVPALPAWKAFVVQFSRETHGEGEQFSGRVEHLSSGRRTPFHSREEMVQILARQLTELEAEPKRRGDGS